MSTVFRTSRDGHEARRARRVQVPGTAVSAGTRRAPTADSSVKSGRRWTSGTGARSCCPSAWSPQGPGLRGQASLCLVSAPALHPPPPAPAAAPKSTDGCSGIRHPACRSSAFPPDRRERGRRTHAQSTHGRCSSARRRGPHTPLASPAARPAPPPRHTQGAAGLRPKRAKPPGSRTVGFKVRFHGPRRHLPLHRDTCASPRQ